jgi:hypothetical protein
MESLTKTKWLFYLLSIFTISTFLWRFLVPAYEESDPNTLIYLKILFELVQVPALVILFSYLRGRYGLDPKGMLTTVFLIALVASIGILVMRFSTPDGWYTGHRTYAPGG